MPELAFEKSKASQPLPYKIKIRNTRVAAPFEGKAFVYRLPNNQWETDFYHEWFAYPRDLITESCIAALNHSGQFKAVTSEDSLMDADYYLEATLNALYLDRRDQDHSDAVLEIRWLLIEHNSPVNPKSTGELWNQTYRVIQGLKSDTHQAYADAIAEALKKVLEQLIVDVSGKIASTSP